MTQQRHLFTAIIALSLSLSALIASVMIYPLTRVLPEEVGLPAFFLLGSTVLGGGVLGLLGGLVGLNGPRRALHQFAIRSSATALALLILLYIVFTTLI